MDIGQQILLSWQKNHHINYSLIEDISDDGLLATLSKRGGRTIIQQFAHLHNVRLSWIETADKKTFETLSAIDTKAPIGRQDIIKQLETSYHAINHVLETGIANNFIIKGFKTGLIPFLSYLISHESHHRGNILLTLKQNGYKISDATKWSIWEWNKAAIL